MNAKNTFIILLLFGFIALGGVMLVKTRFNFLVGPQPAPVVVTTPGPTPAGDYLTVYSPAFENFGVIPSRYTCDGENISPPILFSRVPLEAKSLTLIVDDADAPGGSFVHWVVWNIPVNGGIPEDGQVPGGAVQGLTGFGRNSYDGPCPPESTANDHRYFFKVYALDTELALPSYKKKEDVEKAMTGHILIQSQLVGVYSRKNK